MLFLEKAQVWIYNYFLINIDQIETEGSTFLIVFPFFSSGASDMLILCLELIRGRLGVMSAEIRKLFFIILTTLIEKSPVSITQLHYIFWRQDRNISSWTKASCKEKRTGKRRKQAIFSWFITTCHMATNNFNLNISSNSNLVTTMRFRCQ